MHATPCRAELAQGLAGEASAVMRSLVASAPDDVATRRELAGVLAHEVSHIAHEDLKVMALADIVTRYTSAMSTAGFFLLFFNLFGGSLPWLAILLLLGAPTIGSYSTCAVVTSPRATESMASRMDCPYGWSFSNSK